jgi:hypothetical protein
MNEADFNELNDLAEQAEMIEYRAQLEADARFNRAFDQEGRPVVVTRVVPAEESGDKAATTRRQGKESQWKR